jgi:hypothetical protein
MTAKDDNALDDSEKPKPWDGNPEMERKLEHAGWRYAQLIGIVDVVPEDIPQHEAAEDINKYSHFIHTASAEDIKQCPGWKPGMPIWDEKEATTFVAELTGYDRRICAMWLDYDWNDGGEKCRLDDATPR